MMTDGRILPVFSGLENRAVAEALSEPFIRPDDFVEHIAGTPTVAPAVLDPDSIAAIGALYVEPGSRQAQFEFVMHPEGSTPYAAAQAFVDGYDRAIHPFHYSFNAAKRAMDRLYKDKDSARTSELEQESIDILREDRLSTMGAYVLLSLGRAEYSGILIASRALTIEVPLRRREDQLHLEQIMPKWVDAASDVMTLFTGTSREQISRLKGNTATNTAQAIIGFASAVRDMPQVQALRHIVDADPQVDGFLSMDRKARRAMLKAEHNNADGD
jgi:hypothetical protein